MLTDLAWARAARAPRRRALGRQRATPRAIIYSSTTAALLWPRAGAIRFDAPSAGNRPGRHGLWQRPLERRRLRQAPLLLPWSDGGLSEAPAGAAAAERALVLPVPVEPSGAPQHERDIAAITYAANPLKKGLDRVLAAWRRVRGERPRACRTSCSSRARRRGARDGRPAGRRGWRARRRCARRSERVPRAPAPRARVRVRAAPRGLRHRPARGARRRLPCSSARRRPGPTRRCRSRARSTRGSSAMTSRGRCARRCTIRRPTTRRAR